MSGLERDQVGRLWRNLSRRGVPPAFSRPELEEWLLEASLEREGRAWWCAYRTVCARPLVLAEVSLDHRIPFRELRQTALDNLAVCCARCNRIKGDLDPAHFEQLVLLLRGWPDAYRRSVLRRLAQPPGSWVGRRRERSRQLAALLKVEEGAAA